MPNLKSKLAIVYDWSMFFSVAEALAPFYGEVLYYHPRPSNFPVLESARIGYGYPNIRPIDEDDLWKAIKDKKVDTVFFPDTGDGGLQNYLRSIGIPVYGSELGDKVEIDRLYAKEEFKKNDLLVNKFEVFTDVDKLRAYLEKNEDIYIKISYWRGIKESFHHENWKESETWFYNLASKLGPFRHNFQEIIVEKPIKGKVEVGTDRFRTNKKFLNYGLQGIEVKNQVYIAKVVKAAEISPILKEIDKKAEAVYDKFDIRSSISTEVRVPKKDIGFYIDATLRAGFPPMTSMLMAFGSQIGPIMRAIARNEDIEMHKDYNYVAEMILNSESPLKEPQVVKFPKEYEENVKLKSPCIVDGLHYVLSPESETSVLGTVVCGGDTLQEAIDGCIEIARTVESEGIYFKEKAFDEALEDLKAAEKVEAAFNA